MLQAVGLECVRGQRRLFRDLSFEAQAGELFWVAGPNGSGKTSLLRMLCTLLPPEAGSVRWRGSSARDLGERFRAELVYLGHAAAVKDDLSALENLRFGLAQHGIAPMRRRWSRRSRASDCGVARSSRRARCRRASGGVWRWRDWRSLARRPCGFWTSR